MPGFNSTGPEGQGPRTGRQMGRCKPRPGSDDPEKNTQPDDGMETDPQFAGRGPGKGMGFGRGRGWSFRGVRGWGRGAGAEEAGAATPETPS